MSKTALLFVLLFYFSCFSAFCRMEERNKGTAFIYSQMQDSLVDPQLLFIGRTWRNRYYRVVGDQFLFSADFLKGSVTLNGKTYEDLSIKYDIYTDEIITKTNNGILLQFNKEMVASFSINYQAKSYYFVKMPEDSLHRFNGYINILFNGKCALYVKYKKELDLLSVEEKYDQFYQTNKVYLIMEGVVFPVLNNMGFYKILGDHKQEIRGYMRKNRLKVNKKEPETYVPAIRYYDSLTQ